MLMDIAYLIMRKHFSRLPLRFFVVLVLVVLNVASRPAPSGAAETQDAETLSTTKVDRPNVILIMADDLGVECLGAYGGTEYSTPTLDRLARTGMQFDHCYAQPLCTPSRVKLMTGLSNVRNYVRFGILDQSEKAIGTYFQEAGYRTCVVGKWQLYGSTSAGEFAGTGSTPTQAGFDESCLWQVAKVGSRYPDPVLEENDSEPEARLGNYGPDVFADYVCSFIARHRDEPFFVYYPMALVHDPFVATPASESGLENETKAQRKQRYFGDMVTYMDKIVGRIEGALIEAEIAGNTLLIFVGDNGTHRSIRSDTISTGEVRGGKGMTTNAGTHVPLIVSWPGVIEAGRPVNDDLIEFSDFLPTFFEAIGQEVPAGLDGVSFLPQLRGATGTPRETVFCYYWPRPDRAGTAAVRFVRDKRYKLYGDGRFFDLLKDPLEEHTILVDDDTTEEMKAVLGKLKAALVAMPSEGMKIGSPASAHDDG